MGPCFSDSGIQADGYAGVSDRGAAPAGPAPQCFHNSSGECGKATLVCHLYFDPNRSHIIQTPVDLPGSRRLTSRNQGKSPTWLGHGPSPVLECWSCTLLVQRTRSSGMEVQA